jgi:hypothetical protein
MRILLTSSLVCLLLLTACGGGSGGSAATGPSLAGNWQITLQNSVGNNLKTESGFFLQTGSSLNGNLLLNGSNTVCAGVGSVIGEVSGSNVAITVDQTGQTINLTGTAKSNSSMSGDYSIFSSPCGFTQVGTWTGTLVQPITGAFQATFTSTKIGGLVFHFSGKVTQGQNTGASTASLSGSMTSTDSPCFTEASIAGLVSGTAIVFNLLSSEGVALAQYRGTASTDGKSITGNYDIFTTPPGTCTDFGTATVAF